MLFRSKSTNVFERESLQAVCTVVLLWADFAGAVCSSMDSSPVVGSLLASWGAGTSGPLPLCQKIQRQKAQLPLLKSQEQKQGVGSKSSVLCVTPCTEHHQRVGKPPKPPVPGHTLTLTPGKEQARSSPPTCYLFWLSSSASAEAPINLA